jgi:long-subunit acyl-CoA synthetase (AMP-forming)
MKDILEQPTIARAFLRSVELNTEREAVREFGTDRSLSYREWRSRSAAVAGGLARLGVKRGDRVALMLTHRLEFHVVDMGAVLLGAAPFSLYNTAPVEQLIVNVDNAEPAVVIAEAQFADRARELVALRPQIKLVVVEDDLAALDAAVARVRAGEPWVDDPLLRPLREATGLEHAGWAGISGAPCSREMAERFHAVGIPLSEAWGMSETVIGTAAAPGRIRIGAAGWPYSGTEIRLADDGEILLRSPSVTPGYLKEPERTRAAFTDDGFIKTGDLARFDEDGYLWVVGRKKDIVINSAGKNMSPVNIEHAIRGTDAVIAQVVCFGDGRPYNVGLIVLDPVAAAALAGEDLPAAELARHPVVVAHVARVVEEGNARLSRVEQLKRYTIFAGAWPAGGDELTLTGKLKRADVTAKYAELVDDLYLTPTV